jgi:signal transduction histidine kinase
MRSQQWLQVDNAHADPRHYRKLDTTKGFETRSILAVPLTAKDRTIGVLEVLNKRELPWTEDNVTYLSILADQAAVAIRSSQLMVELRRANEELSELDNLKNDFIAIASHELRTPLGVILGYASFLQDMSDGEVSEHATKVVNSALQLRGIIEDLTNLRFLKEGETTITRSYVSLNSLIDDTLGDVVTMGDARGHRLEIIHSPEDLRLFVDPIRVGMALTNVMNNAIRFTPDGGHILVEAAQHGSDEAWITVTDNGIGLNHNQLERIFDEFYQLEDHMTRKHGGLGIGLSIARALVDANGGRIWASSPGLGQGATFTLALPLAKESKTR